MLDLFVRAIGLLIPLLKWIFRMNSIVAVGNILDELSGENKRLGVLRPKLNTVLLDGCGTGWRRGCAAL